MSTAAALQEPRRHLFLWVYWIPSNRELKLYWGREAAMYCLSDLKVVSGYLKSIGGYVL